MKDVVKLINKNDFLASIDIKDSYFLIAIDPEFKKYLKFKFENNYYAFNCLPFGLSSAPFVFTKIMKPIIEFLRSRGYKCEIYLDDFLFMARSWKECEKIIKIAMELLISLGFLLSEKKCQLIPNTRCTFLGFIIDSKDYSIYLTDDKREKISNLLSDFYKQKHCKIRVTAQIIGTLVSACPGAKYSWVYTKHLERQKYLALEKSNDNFSKRMTITNEIREDLKWWLDNISITKNPIRKGSYKLEIFSDASLSEKVGKNNGGN